MNKERLEKLLNYLNDGSKDPFIRYALATEYAKIKEYDLALKYYQNLVENDPEYVGTYYHLGRLLENLDRKEEAISIYEKGMDIALKVKNMHAYSELKGVHQSALGLELDDDDF